ncbi:MAG: Clp protease N-terminal domain-containing protein [Hyphomicrobiaceae bacterium]|nr:hypothetical protein [Hyphomicrobiaceae bacterium]
MSYRGDDLDLRTPPSRGSRESYAPEYGTNGSRPRGPVSSGRASSGASAVVIDDVVMTCCNHAYDIAQAHGANEVRLEHLVHALTRVEAAADILEERGIREAHLRRESAAVIASEIPVGLAHSQSAPRASSEFEDVLRRASDMAANQGNADGASVHDLLWVLLNYDQDIPAIALLLRHAAGWQSWDWPHRRDTRNEPRSEVVREIVREVRVSEPRRDDVRREEPRRETVRYSERREEPRRPVNRKYATERTSAPPPVVERPAVIERIVQAPRNDEVLDRIDALEGTMRSLIDLVRDLQSDLHANRGGSVSVDVAPDAFIDHVRNVEATFDDRLIGLEKAVASISSDSARHWNTFGDRMKSIDKLANSSQSGDLADLVTEQLVAVTEQVRAANQRVAELETNLQRRDSEASRAWTGIAERLRALDEGISSQKREVQQTLLSAGQTGQAVQSTLVERFTGMRQQLDQGRDDLIAGVTQIVQPVALRQQESHRLVTTVAERVSSFENIVRAQTEAVTQANAVHQRDLSEVHEALLKLGANQKTLSEGIEQWRLDSGGDLGIISNRLELLEKGSGRPIELIEQMQSDLANVTQLALADYDQNRRSFKTWLFGTSDVFAGSWRDETTAIRNRLRELRVRKA